MRKIVDKKAITLIALVITIIVLLILAGITINLTIGQDGIMKIAQEAGKQYNKSEAKEKLELVLLEIQTNKDMDIQYNESEYINNIITSRGMKINGNIVNVDGWEFEIDKSVPRVLEENERYVFDYEKASKDLTINDVNIDEQGIADFSNDDSWIKINQLFEPGNEKWEMMTKISFSEYVNNYQHIFGKTGSHNPPVLTLNSNGKLCLDVSSNDTQWNIASKEEGMTKLELNKWYWIKVSYDTQKYQVSISTDGENYVQDIVVNDSTVAAQGDEVVLGHNLWSGTTNKGRVYCKIDLMQSYVKYEKNYIFNGNKYVKIIEK